MSKKTEQFIVDCNKYFTSAWEILIKKISENEYSPPNLELPYVETIKAILTSNTMTYHYVLPTNLLAKLVDSNLDCRSAQASFDTPSAFDARTLAKEVICEFDRHNSNVLGGSRDPYVSNPLRVPAFISDYRGSQKVKKDWDLIVDLLGEVENRNDPNFTKALFQYTLFEIHNLLQDVSISYPTPSRVSLNRTIEMINKFLSSASGGDNQEIIAVALLTTLAQHFSMFEKVASSKVNASDKSSGLAADIECFIDGSVALLVEVKDQRLTVSHIDTKVESARAKNITEILFLAQQGIAPLEQKDAEKTILQEFNSGHNIYSCTIIEFALGMLILLGEKGRVKFLAQVGIELDKRSSPVRHRKSWAMLLRNS